MNVFLYTKKATFLHGLDPRTKILVLFAFFITSVFLQNLVALGAVLLVMLALFALAKSTANILRMGVLFCIIAATTFLLWLLFCKGQGSAVMYAGAQSLRFVDLLLAGLLFLSITSLEEFYAGLMLCGMPYPMAFALSLSFRLVVIFVSTGFTIVEAQKVRGNDVKGGSILKRIRSYAPLLVPLILSGVKKAETLTIALESKGFSPNNKINIKDRYAMKPSDWLTVALGLALCVAAFLFRFPRYTP